VATLSDMADTIEVTLTVRERIRKAREDAGLKQVELAELVGVSRGTVSGWEQAERVPTNRQAKALSKATGGRYPAWWLLGFDSLEEAVSTMWYTLRTWSTRHKRTPAATWRPVWPGTRVYVVDPA
jgi:transcriptional regulator with XRE-family HTH domain